MKMLKLRGITNATHLTTLYNETSEPEPVQEFNDTGAVDWTDTASQENYYIGEQALNISEPAKEGYKLYWPIQRSSIVCHNESLNVSLGNLETIWRWALSEKLGIKDALFDVSLNRPGGVEGNLKR